MKYDSAHIDPLLKALSEGFGRVRSCKAAGITHNTLIIWLEEKHDFHDAVKKAEAVGEDLIKDMARRGIIEKFATQWQAAAWYLERRYPDEYKNRTEIKHDTTLEDARKYLIEKLAPNAGSGDD
jgi:hypothetical protein